MMCLNSTTRRILMIGYGAEKKRNVKNKKKRCERKDKVAEDEASAQSNEDADSIERGSQPASGQE